MNSEQIGKNLHTGPRRRMRVVSLTDNVPWLTAAANDQGYENCFAEQLRNYLQPGDLVVVNDHQEPEHQVARSRLVHQGILR